MRYCSNMSSNLLGSIEIISVREEERPLLAVLLAEIRAEDKPGQGMEETISGMKRSLDRYDALSSDSAWFLTAFVAGRPVGYASFIRIPKLDRRVGFLYLDELHVVERYRLQGVGSALIERGDALVVEHDLVGIRLLARPENIPAQRFYERLAFSKNEAILYERLLG